ncbi:MAG: hypothetical protein GVY21_01785 [Gammaproteobacteria bacterium]|jgi:hypothetical protein|nr:hypothetical protein [Gammaproteobacteria bacterium]
MLHNLTNAAAAVLLATLAADAGAARATSIPFADLGNIEDWRAEGHDAMLIESQRGQWYRATFYAPCYELPFAETVGFVTEPGGSLSKFSSIVAGGQRCWFKTFEKTAPPE